MKYMNIKIGGINYAVDLEMSRFRVCKSELDNKFYKFKEEKIIPKNPSPYHYSEIIHEIISEIPLEIGEAILELGPYVYQAGWTTNVPTSLVEKIEKSGVKLHFSDLIQEQWCGGNDGSVHAKPCGRVKKGEYISSISFNGTTVHLKED